MRCVCVCMCVYTSSLTGILLLILLLLQRSSSGCLLGSAVSIQRRKPTVCCLNSQQYNRVVNFTVCACVPEDFEWSASSMCAVLYGSTHSVEI